MKMQVKKFENWVNESQTPNEAFIERFKKALEGVEYTITSSERQLKNGTLEITITEISWAEEALREWNIAKSDFKDSGYEDLMTRVKKPIWEEGLVKFPYIGKGNFTIYSRGAIRADDASSDGIKFNSPETGVNWMKETFKRNLIYSCRELLKRDNFYSKIKTYPLDLEKVKPYMTEIVYEWLNLVKEKDTNLFMDLSKSFNTLAFIASMYKAKINARTGTSMESGHFYLECSEFTLQFDFSEGWKVPNKKKELSFEMRKDWYFRGGVSNKYGSLKDILPLFPGYVKNMIDELMKKDQPFSDLTHRFRGVIAARKFGI